MAYEDMRDKMLELDLSGAKKKPWEPDRLWTASVGRYMTPHEALAIETFCVDESGLIETYDDVTVNLDGHPDIGLVPDDPQITWVRDRARPVLDKLIELGIAEIVGSVAYGLGPDTAWVVRIDENKLPSIA